MGHATTGSSWKIAEAAGIDNTASGPGPHEPARYAAAYVTGFVLLNLLIKLACIQLNQGEYTDGILQLEVFRIPSKLYPPLFGLLAHFLASVGVELETAGRLISIIASSLTVIPIYCMGRRLYNDSAARLAAVFYTFSPLVMRWSIRAMTDSLFLFLETSAFWMMLESWMLSSGGLGALAAQTDPLAARRGADRRLALANALVALSALTRYQGAFAGLLLLIPAAAFVLRQRAIPVRTLAVSVIWAALPLWMWHHGFVHQQQFASRTTGAWITTLLAWLNLFESFVLVSPYFFTFPLFVMFVIGLFRLNYSSRAVRSFLWLWCIWTLIVLAVQSVFGSFQYRYMLPVLPMWLVIGGAGCAWLESNLAARRPVLFSLIFICSVAYMGLFSCAVLVFQRETLRDQKLAGLFLKRNFPPNVPAFSNERYGEFWKLGCVKLSFWSGRTVEPVFPYLPPRPGYPPPKHLPGGSIVIMGNEYGGDTHMDELLSQLTYFYHMRELDSYDATAYPLLDDIMLSPMLNQNPLAWVLRYTPQLFSTHVYIVDSQRSQQEIDGLLKRQVLPPGTRYIKDKNGRVTVSSDDLTSNLPQVGGS